MGHHHGGRVFPRYRSSQSEVPNLAPGLLRELRRHYKVEVAVPDVLAHVAGVAAHSGYTQCFAEELNTPRVRITSDTALWLRAVEIGRACHMVAHI